jgi:hypothetical protein
MSGATLLQSVVEALQGLTGSELEHKTSVLLEEVRSLAGGAEGPEFAGGLVARVTGSADLRASSDQRRAFARFLDAAVELAGPAVVTRECAELLLLSVAAGPAAKSESAVAGDVLLGVLGAGAAGAAWEAAWAGAARHGEAARLLVAALERFPRAALPAAAARLAGPDPLLPLELLAAAGLRAAPIAEPEPVLKAVPALLEAARVAGEPRVAAAALLALAGLLRAVTRRSLAELVETAGLMDVMERGLAWPGGAPQPPAAAAALFLVVYSVLPSEALRRLREWSGRAPAFATAARRLLAARALPLHPGLLAAEEELSDMLVDHCWSGLLAGAALPQSTLPVPAAAPEGEAWESELERLESQLSQAAVATETLCVRAGLRFLPLAAGAGPEEGGREARASAALARIELLFERLQRAKTVASVRQEDAAGVIEFGESGTLTVGSGTRHNVVSSAAEHDTTDTSESELLDDVPPPGAIRPESAASRLKSLLAAARAEAAVHEQAADGLRRRLHQSESALREERDRSKAAAAAVAATATVAESEEAAEQEARLGELEARLEAATRQLCSQQTHEAELALLQHDLASWDAAAAEERARQQDGTDPAAQLAAGRAEVRALEETVLESQAHHQAALAEMAQLTTTTSAALAESLRSEREVEDLRRTMHKMMNACQERIAAVEDKYASLQELHAGLLSELSRRK